MIARVHAKGFKNREFTVDLSAKTIIVGPNGAGKSAVVQALQLALEGQVTGAVHKTNQAVMDAFTTDATMFVEARGIGNGEAYDLGRQFSRNGKGSVTQALMVDRRKTDLQAWSKALVAAGSPRVVAVDEFLSMSSRAMIAHFAKNFGGEKIDALAEGIEKTRTTLLRRQAELKENEVFISRTARSVADLNLPAGSAAQVADELERTAQELKAAEAELAAAQKAERKRIKDEEEEAKTQASQTFQEEHPDPAQGPRPPSSPESRAAEERLLRCAAQQPVPLAVDARARAIASIKKIIEAIVAVNCPGCAGGFALQVAKMELKKWEAR